MRDAHPALAAYALAGVLAVCITILTGIGVPVPDVLGYTLAASLGGGAGLSTPRRPTVRPRATRKAS